MSLYIDLEHFIYSRLRFNLESEKQVVIWLFVAQFQKPPLGETFEIAQNIFDGVLLVQNVFSGIFLMVPRYGFFLHVNNASVPFQPAMSCQQSHYYYLFSRRVFSVLNQSLAHSKTTNTLSSYNCLERKYTGHFSLKHQ